MQRSNSSPQRSIRRHLIVLCSASCLFFLGLIGVSATVDMSGAVVASGNLVVDSELKKVQHPNGGIVAELLVTEGAHVNAGDVVIRLDPVVAQATLTAVTKDLWELTARKARLEAERDSLATIAFPKDLVDLSDNPTVASLMSGESKLFHFRMDALTGQKRQLKARIGQLGDEIKGLEVQIEAKQSEIALVKTELEGVRELWDKKLIPMTRLTALEREAARLNGEDGQLAAALAQTKGKVSETELQIIQLDQTMRSDDAKELADIRAKISELTEKKVTAADQMRRIDIRAPQSGVVHELSVHTRGGVINAGEQLMLIVPDRDALSVEVRIPPKDIDQLVIGQSASLRFANFNQRTTPEIRGTISRIGADITKDEHSDQPYYVVRIAMADISKLGAARLIPGMPVEAFIQTQPRSMISYLVRPLLDQVRRAFREK